MVETPADLYTLTIDQLSKLDRMGKKSAANVHKSLWASNTISLDVFVGGLSIPLIGGSSIRLLMDAGYDSLDKLFSLSIKQMEAIKGLGTARAESLFNGLQNNKDTMKKLLDNGVKIKEKVTGTLSGKSFCITGSTNLKRAVLETMITDNGGINKSSVSKDTMFLIIADVDSQSSKAVKARSLGTILISEDQFLRMIA